MLRVGLSHVRFSYSFKKERKKKCYHERIISHYLAVSVVSQFTNSTSSTICESHFCCFLWDMFFFLCGSIIKALSWHWLELLVQICRTNFCCCHHHASSRLWYFLAHSGRDTLSYGLTSFMDMEFSVFFIISVDILLFSRSLSLSSFC